MNKYITFQTRIIRHVGDENDKHFMWATQCPQKFAGKQIQVINTWDLTAPTTLKWGSAWRTRREGKLPCAETTRSRPLSLVSATIKYETIFATLTGLVVSNKILPVLCVNAIWNACHIQILQLRINTKKLKIKESSVYVYEHKISNPIGKSLGAFMSLSDRCIYIYIYIYDTKFLNFHYSFSN
jgi:hypothetical protein